MLTEGMYVADRYEIVSKIGAGGMSDVYKAKDHILGRNVAIKVLKQEFSEDRTFVVKFRTEAQSAAGLEHPNIVNIYDVGSEEGFHYIVMEYVEGITLKTYIEKKGQLSFKEAVSIAIQVARGIEAAHNKDIIHRDIKPQNIIISTEGKVKVTDFGIAKAISSNTVSSDVMGSVHYTSPEHARNGQVDGRSDIYSLGIVMYEMVTGRVPFDGESTVAVAIQHLQEEMVHPSAYAPNLPISLEQIILKSTMKNPDRRYQTIAELLNDLRTSLSHPNDDFVVMAPSPESGVTKVITHEDIKEINEVAEAAGMGKSNINAFEEEDDYEKDFEEDDGEINPKVQKAMTISLIVIAAIIVLLIFFILGSIFGLFGKRKPKDNNTESQNTESQMDTETESESESESEADSEAGEEVEMVSILGMTLSQAKDALNEYEINVVVKEYREAKEGETYKEGEIMEQTPGAGEKIQKGGTVEVVVCEKAAAEKVVVPGVVGFTEEAAKSALIEVGLDYDITYQFNNDVAAGLVISQSPEKSTEVAKGTKIQLVISQGKESVEVPDVSGMTEEEAVNTLEDKGFVTEIVEEFSDTVEAGLVISTNPRAGKTVAHGTSITITVSKGPEIVFYKATADIFGIPEGATEITWTLIDDSGTIYDNGSLPDGTTNITLTSKALTNKNATKFAVSYVLLDEDGNPLPAETITFAANY